MQQKTLVIILAVIILIALAALGVYMFYPQAFKFLPTSQTTIERDNKPKVIEETLIIPQTEKIIGSEGRFSDETKEGNIETPLVPKTEAEKVIVLKAILTVKGSYDVAISEARKWASDAAPVFIKSLGAVTLEGKSSQWQLVFSSVIKKDKGYEIVIQGDGIVSQKEINSKAVGAILPENLKDSAEAISVLQDLPQYSDAALTAISLYYNADMKKWRYNMTTSEEATTVPAQ